METFLHENMSTYKTFNKYVIRKPLFSYDLLFNSASETKDIEHVLRELIEDNVFTTSLYWSSPDLYETVIKYKNNNLKESKRERLFHTLKKYVIRACTRCTPYGTLAGVALRDILFNDDESSKSLLRKARIDMEFLAEIKFNIESNKNIKRNLRYKINNTVSTIPHQYRYQEPVGKGGEAKFQISSLEVNEHLEQLLKFTDFKSYREITGCFSEQFSSEEVSDFIDELIDMKFLVSELQLTLTNDNVYNIKSVLQRLDCEEVSDVKFFLNLFEKIEGCIIELEETPLSYLPVSQIDEIKYLAKSIDINKKHFFHVDLKHSLEDKFTLDERMLKNIIDSLSILHVLSPANSKNTDLEIFKNIFAIKYELEEVSLSEVLDSEFGIGFPATSQIGNLFGNSLIEGLAQEKDKIEKNIQTSSVLLDLIEKEKTEIIRLENSDLGNLDKAPFKNQGFFVVGSPIGDKFFLQNVGISSANSILGRFGLLDQKILQFCDTIKKSESEQNPEIIFAEIIYIPENRTANIARRPTLSEYEIPIFANSSSDYTKQIFLDDIMVSVVRDEIILRSKRLNKRIIPRLSNAHNYHNSDNSAYKFLGSIQYQNQRDINLHIDYSKSKKRFIPRIVFKNLILHRASWIMHDTDIKIIKNTETPLLELKKFIKRWNISKYVVLIEGDNELFIDTTNESYLLLFIEELKNKKIVQLSEWLHDIDSEKRYNQQVIIPFENKNFKLFNSSIQHHSTLKRHFAPGSEWLSAKLYCNSNFSEILLSRLIKPLITDLIEGEVIKSAFFIRYVDPHYHIRLRLNLNNIKDYLVVLQKLQKIIEPYFHERTIWNFQLDSYRREVERYYPEYMEATEQAFYYDSLLILDLLGNEEFMESEPIKLFSAVKNVDFWLSLFDMSLQEKIDYCKVMENNFLNEFSTEFKSHINKKYRILKDELYLFLKNSQFDTEFNYRQIKLKKIELCKELVSSYIHMSINRWFSSEQRALELMTYSFAVKYYCRILNHPI